MPARGKPGTSPARRGGVVSSFGYPPAFTNDALLTQFRKDGIHGVVFVMEGMPSHEIAQARAICWDGRIGQSSVMDVEGVREALCEA